MGSIFFLRWCCCWWWWWWWWLLQQWWGVLLTHAFRNRVCKHIPITFIGAVNWLTDSLAVKCTDGFIKLCCWHRWVEKMLDHLPLVWYNVLAVSHICSMTLASIQKNRQILYEVLVVTRNIDTSFLTYFHILFIYSQTWLNPLCR